MIKPKSFSGRPSSTTKQSLHPSSIKIISFHAVPSFDINPSKMTVANLALAVCILVATLGLYEGEIFNPYATPEDPVITTMNGDVKGQIVKMPSSDISVFFGIPYAKPPVGNYRFKKPIPSKPWSGIFDATMKQPSCMQRSSKDYPWVDQENVSEDCLYLNIWVPCGFPATNPYRFPVMVWIHGGAFQYGSGTQDIYDGSVLADTANVIVVSMNYRLGVFGFLDAGVDDAPGNMGLLDQTLALNWIKDNIEYFGGNPNMITLFGQSAGAISVGLHMVSPLSRDLFHQAIMESGSPYHPHLGFPPLLVKMKGSLFATHLGCSNDTWNLVTDPKGVVACLRNIDAEKLAMIDSAILETVPFFFIPTSGNEFMPKSPIEYIDSGDMEYKNLLIGFVKDEGSFLVNYVMPQIFDRHFVPPLSSAEGYMLISAMFQNSTSPTPDDVAKFYLRNVDPQDSGAVAKLVYDSFGDFLFACPSLLFARKNKDDVHFYHYTHRPTNSKWGDWMGTAHFDEVPFVFGVPLRIPYQYTAEEGRFSQNVIQKWGNFAHTGYPGLSESIEHWPEFTSENPFYQELNPRSRKIESGLKEEECDFWQKHFSAASPRETKSTKG